MTDRARLEDLAQRVARLMPDRRDPTRFHEEKDDIARQLRRVADGLDRGQSP